MDGDQEYPTELAERPEWCAQALACVRLFIDESPREAWDALDALSTDRPAMLFARDCSQACGCHHWAQSIQAMLDREELQSSLGAGLNPDGSKRI